MANNSIYLTVASDVLLSLLAQFAGAPDEVLVTGAREVLLEPTDLGGKAEVWVEFTCTESDGQSSVAHHPGRLRDLIADTVLTYCNSEVSLLGQKDHASA